VLCDFLIVTSVGISRQRIVFAANASTGSPLVVDDDDDDDDDVQ
jgi:hypothetical protein